MTPCFRFLGPKIFASQQNVRPAQWGYEEIQGNIQPSFRRSGDGMTKMDGIPVNDHRSQ
jgi:hypothetical protein